jgi:hypothetical protein
MRDVGASGIVEFCVSQENRDNGDIEDFVQAQYLLD